MSQLPITSRVKRSPLLKGSPYKQTGTPEANVVSPGEDKEVKKKEIVETPESMEPVEDICGPNDMRPGCVALRKMSPEEIRQAEIDQGRRVEAGKKEVITTSIEKGDDVIAPTYSKRTGDVQTNFEGRQLGRQTKFKNRYVRQSKNKLAKAKDKMANFQKKFSKPGVDEDGKPTSVFTAPKAGEKGYKQYMRLDSKISENENELADFESGASNQAEVMRSGKTIGKSYRRDEDRRDTAADQTKEERIAQVRAEQEAAGGIVSSGQAANAVEVNNTATTTEQEGTTDNTQYGKYETKPAPNKMRSAFKMKAKSPAAKKLQGAQNTLPQHLQAAIKAAPGKMRSGFKMKGYGKK